jgi:hypothetical protein
MDAAYCMREEDEKVSACPIMGFRVSVVNQGTWHFEGKGALYLTVWLNTTGLKPGSSQSV